MSKFIKLYTKTFLFHVPQYKKELLKINTSFKDSVRKMKRLAKNWEKIVAIIYLIKN